MWSAMQNKAIYNVETLNKAQFTDSRLKVRFDSFSAQVVILV